MMPRVAPLALLLACLLGLTGCGHSAPSARVAEAMITRSGPEGAVVAFVIEMDNPNAYALPLHEARYTLRLDGGTSLGVVRVPKTTLRPGGTERFELPIAIAEGEGLEAALSRREDGTVAYRLSGTVVYRRPGEIAERLFDARLSRPTASFSDRGTIQLPR